MFITSDITAPSWPDAAQNSLVEANLTSQTLNAQTPDWAAAGASSPDFNQPCPAGWNLDHENNCFAPATYVGPCIRRKHFRSLSLKEKLTWGWMGITLLTWLMNAGVAAIACKAPWPARQVAPSPILHDFKSLCAPNYKAMCPDQWAQHGRSCMAPPHYKVASFGQNCLMLQMLTEMQGRCGIVLDPTHYTAQQKNVRNTCNLPQWPVYV